VDKDIVDLHFNLSDAMDHSKCTEMITRNLSDSNSDGMNQV